MIFEFYYERVHYCESMEVRFLLIILTKLLL